MVCGLPVLQTISTISTRNERQESRLGNTRTWSEANIRTASFEIDLLFPRRLGERKSANSKLADFFIPSSRSSIVLDKNDSLFCYERALYCAALLVVFCISNFVVKETMIRLAKRIINYSENSLYCISM